MTKFVKPCQQLEFKLQKSLIWYKTDYISKFQRYIVSVQLKANTFVFL